MAYTQSRSLQLILLCKRAYMPVRCRHSLPPRPACTADIPIKRDVRRTSHKFSNLTRPIRMYRTPPTKRIEISRKEKIKNENHLSFRLLRRILSGKKQYLLTKRDGDGTQRLETRRNDWTGRVDARPFVHRPIRKLRRTVPSPVIAITAVYSPTHARARTHIISGR